MHLKSTGQTRFYSDVIALFARDGRKATVETPDETYILFLDQND